MCLFALVSRVFSTFFSPITFYSYFILDAIKTRHRLRLEVRDFLKLSIVIDLQKYGSLASNKIASVGC